MFFGFLGTRGAWLDNGSSYTEPGNLLNKFSLTRSKGSMVKSSIVYALQHSLIEITHTNSQVEPGQDLLATGAVVPNYFKAVGTGWVGQEFDPTV
jgi:hypothetical protein